MLLLLLLCCLLHRRVQGLLNRLKLLCFLLLLLLPHRLPTVSISGNTVTIKSVGAGTATITVKSASNTNYNEKTAIYTVTVKYPTFTGNSGVGYYADVDGNGTVDGIIFIDLKKGASGSWGDIWFKVSYNISKVSGTKSYKVSQQNYNGPFGKKDVLVANG